LEDGWIVGKIDDRMGRLMDGWIDGWIDGWYNRINGWIVREEW